MKPDHWLTRREQRLILFLLALLLVGGTVLRLKNSVSWFAESEKKELR